MVAVNEGVKERVRIYNSRAYCDSRRVPATRRTRASHLLTVPMSPSEAPSDTNAPIPTPTSPPRPRSSNKMLPSPLRPNSAPQPSGSPRSATLPTASPTTAPLERSKTRARDLLRKHYGLSVTPPPPSGQPMDPLDLGQRSSKNILRPINKTPLRLTSI